MYINQLFTNGLDAYALPVDASVSEIVHAHTRKAPIPLGGLAPDLPDEVADVVRRGLDKNAQNRPRAQELADVLRAALAALPALADVPEVAEVSAAPAVAPRRMPWMPGVRVAVVVAVGVSALLAIAALATGRHGRGHERAGPHSGPAPPLVAPRALVRSSPPAVSPPAERGGGLRLEWARPGVVSVYNGGDADLVEVKVHVAEETYVVGALAAHTEMWIVTGKEGALSAEALARDGTQGPGGMS